MHRCLLYYITDRTAFPGDDAARRRQLLDKISEAACAGVDFIQLREKDLSSRELEHLAMEVARTVKDAPHTACNSQRATRLLINSRTDIALAIGADGVHLRSEDVSPEDVHNIWTSGTGMPAIQPLISVSCHTAQEVKRSADVGASFALFAPVFEKRMSLSAPSTGLDELRRACRSNIRVLALGGVTIENATQCLDAGASGIAAIRLFQENNIAQMAQKMRSL